MYFEDYPPEIRQSIWKDAVHALSGYAFKYRDVRDVLDEFSPSQEMRGMILAGDYHGVEFNPSDIPSALAALALEGDDATWDEIPVPVRTYRSMARSSVPKAVGSANRKKVDKAERLPFYTFRRQAAKVSNRKAVRTSADYLAELGYNPLDVIQIGEDPGTGDVVNLAIAQYMGDGGFYVVRIEDRSKGGSSSPYAVSTVWSGYRREDAVRVEAQERQRLLASYTWYVPGTRVRVRGCRA